MIAEHTISWTEGQVATRLATYRRLFLASILTNVVVGLMALFFPTVLADIVGQQHAVPEGWPRVWGGTLLGLHLVYLPGWRDPLFNRWPNWSSILIKFGMTLIFLSQSGDFLLFAIWDASWGTVLLMAYARLMQAELQRRP